MYRARACGANLDARAWVPFPNVDAFQTLGDLRDDNVPKRERVLTSQAPASIREPRRTARLTRRRRRQERRRRRRRRVAYAALAVLTAAVGALDLPQLQRHPSQVTIRVDGKERVSAQTDAKNVAGALRAHDVKVNAGDRVRPRPTAKVSDGMTVDVTRSFPVDVDFDGVVTPVRTAWAKPVQMLEQLRLDPDRVSIVTAPTRLTQGSSVVIRTLRRVTVSVDGTHHTETTPALDVGEFLEQNHVALGPDDELSPSADTALSDGMTVTVARVVKDTETIEEPLPAPMVTQDDPAMVAGQQGVLQQGVPGVQQVVYEITKRDGQEVERTPISSVPIQPPTPTIIAVGSALANLPPG